jgi:hypothetical protein
MCVEDDKIGTLVYNGKTIAIKDFGDYGIAIPDLATTNGNLPLTARILAEVAIEQNGVVTIDDEIMPNDKEAILKKLFNVWSGSARL